MTLGACSQATPTAFDGDACAPLGSACTDQCGCGLVCDRSLCRVPLGAICERDDDCVGTCINDICSPRADAGEPCDSQADCVTGYDCTDDGICLAVNGIACTDNGECQHGACINDHCSDPSPFRGPCDEPTDCRSDYTCGHTGTCRSPEGAACGSNPDCVDVCLRGSCGQRQAVDGSCDEGADCTSGYCNGVVCRPLYLEPNIGYIQGGCAIISITCNGEVTAATTCSWDCTSDDNGYAHAGSRDHCWSLGGTWWEWPYWDSHCEVPNSLFAQ
jgi:hypothetical protein